VCAFFFADSHSTMPPTYCLPFVHKVVASLILRAEHCYVSSAISVVARPFPAIAPEVRGFARAGWPELMPGRPDKEQVPATGTVYASLRFTKRLLRRRLPGSVGTDSTKTKNHVEWICVAGQILARDYCLLFQRPSILCISYSDSLAFFTEYSAPIYRLCLVFWAVFCLSTVHVLNNVPD
jgi:hypothetical protein